jgi:hypothetical protein
MAHEFNNEGWFVQDCLGSTLAKRCRTVSNHVTATSGDWVKVLKMQLAGNERTALGMVTLVNRTGNTSMDLQKFWFAAINGSIEAKVFERQGNSIINTLRIAYNETTNEWWIEARMQIPVQLVTVVPAGLYNCCVIDDVFAPATSTVEVAQCSMI